jgi:MFS family permease
MEQRWFMFYISNILGLSSYPKELKNLTVRLFILELIVSSIYLSHAWITLYYLSILDSYILFGNIIAIGMIFGAFLDVPLGILTDRIGQRIAFCSALACLFVYYFGLNFASSTVALLFLEILVGIYSALISGTYISWFLNSWENFLQKDERKQNLIRNAMGTVNFTKMISISALTLLGGFLLNQVKISPNIIFLLQSIIVLVGLFIGYILMVENKDDEINEKQLDASNDIEDKEKLIQRIGRVFNEKYISVSPFFISFALLSFTTSSFILFILPLIIYLIIQPDLSSTTNSLDFDFTSVAILLLSIVNSVSDLAYGISCRFSGRFTSFVVSPYRGILTVYFLNFPVVWFSIFIILLLDLEIRLQIFLIVSIFILKLIISGLTSGLHWHLYYEITDQKFRSSQESYLNTLNLVISVLGFSFLGIIIERIGLEWAICFLFFISTIAFVFLCIAKEPNSIKKAET